MMLFQKKNLKKIIIIGKLCLNNKIVCKNINKISKYEINKIN